MSWVPPGPAWLFCPADRPDRYAKAAAVADVVILDLEDGVAAADKAGARHSLQEQLLEPARTVVRVNPVGAPDHALDLEALESTPYNLVMLAKTESAEQVASLAPRQVIALCETPAGVLAAPAVAACSSTAAMMWGAEDLVAALGGRSSRRGDGSYRDVARYSRAQILLAAGAYGLPAIDAVHLDIEDIEGLRQEASDGAASGFAATACIHPSQVTAVRESYRPTDDELAWAHLVIEAARHSAGIFSFQGRMIDAPVLRHAHHMVERAV
jgi:citrate lyase subunit beta/citryl-CoA lyase